MAKTVETDVVIVGAGIAGLSAAEYLYSNGLTNLVVLEASNRVGGRICTANFGANGNGLVEMGAANFHGLALTSSMVTLANRFKLLNYSNDRRADLDIYFMESLLDFGTPLQHGFQPLQHCFCGITVAYTLGANADHWFRQDIKTARLYSSKGRAINDELSSEAYDQFEEWTEEDPPGATVNCEEYLRQKFQKGLKKKSKGLDAEEIEDLKSVFNTFIHYSGIWVGNSMKNLNGGAFLVGDDDIEGGDLKMSGLSKLVDCLRAQLPDDKVLLNHEVNTIALEGDTVTMSCPDVRYRAKHVIVTSSLGYLKENAKTLFKPPLPTNKMEAIDKIGFGRIGKIFAEWEQPFWTKGKGGIIFAYDDASNHMQNEGEWYKSIVSFDEVVDNDNVLMGWVGYDGVNIMEGLSDEEVRKTVTSVLRKFLNNPSIPAPTAVKKTGWCSDRLYRGTYCHHALETTEQHWDDMEKPVCDGKGVPRILFAGEAMRNNGTMHGARVSGLREAETLLELNNLQTIPKLP